MGKRVLVTGGTGFLGRYIVEELGRHDYVVTVVCRRSPAQAQHGVRYLVGDICDASFVDGAFAGIDLVFHVAGNIRTPATDTPERHRAVNLGGTANVLSACRHQGVGRLTYVSTCEVYGEHAGEHVPEDALKSPANAYAESKWLAEQECQKVTAADHLHVTVIRPGYIFGHGQFEGRLFPRLIKAACAAQPGDVLPLTPSPGGNDFVYVRAVAEGTVLLGTRSQRDLLEVFNLGSGTYTTVRAVFEMIRELTGVNFAEPAPSSSSCPRFSLSIEKAAAAGFVLRYSLGDGLEESVAFQQRMTRSANEGA